jgi:signal transduction histidine kinase
LRERLRDLLAERTRMLAAIAHDYRTYLTRLELRSEFIEDERQRAAAAEDLAEMRMLLADTLTFARESVHRDGDGATCDLRGVAGHRQGTVRLGSGCRDRDDGWQRCGQHVWADPHSCLACLFQRMLANLLDNAMRYGGGRAMLHIRSDAERVNVIVEDDGPGVPKTVWSGCSNRLSAVRPRGRVIPAGWGWSVDRAGTGPLLSWHAGAGNRTEGGFRAILTLRRAPSARGGA